MILLNCPMEPNPMRFSSQWDEWFKQAFTRNSFHFETVYGYINGFHPSGNLSGGFNDPVDTWHWKFGQLKRLILAIELLAKGRRDKKIVVFFHDGWMPGVECIPYLRQMAGLNIHVCSFFHGASLLGTDLLNYKDCDLWAGYSERSWLLCNDLAFVGSQYFADSLYRHLPNKKLEDLPDIRVTGYPVEVPNLPRVEKEPIVVWPHRISPDKGPDMFETVVETFRKNFPNYSKYVKFIQSSKKCQTKGEYYNLLNRAKVVLSTAPHETFGIAMVEGAILGCYPVAPEGRSYPEVLGKGGLYRGVGECCAQIADAIDKPEPFKYDLADQWNPVTVTDKICQAIKERFE